MRTRIWVFLICVAMFTCFAVAVFASGGFFRSAECVFEPIKMPEGPGPVELKLAFSPTHECDEVTVTITKLWNIEWSGDTSWTVEVEKGVWYERTLYIDIPANDTSGIEVAVKCGRIPNDLYAYFVTTGDTVEFHLGNPRYSSPLVTTPEYSPGDPIRDTMTAEQLQTEYLIAVDLRDPDHLAFATKLLGPLPDSCEQKGRKGTYITNMTMEQVLKLAEKGIDLDRVRTSETKQKNSPPPKPVKPDSIGRQGAIFPKGGMRSPDGLSLDHVTGLSAQGDLLADQEITFHLRLYNNTSNYIVGHSLGFRVYSPDGAQWDPITYDTADAGWGNMYEYVFFSPFSITGSGADTVGFGGYKIFLNGIYPGFDEVATLISTSVDPIYDGYTLCIDSCYYPPGGAWMWSMTPYPSVYPEWDGPHCFTIQAFDSIAFSGHLNYLDPVPPDTTVEPMRGVRIEMWDDDLVADDMLDSDTTDANGYFTLGPVENDDASGTLDIFFRIYAENDVTDVRIAYNGDLHKLQTAVHDNLPSGMYDTTFTASLAQSKPFFVADVMSDAYETGAGIAVWMELDKVQVVVADVDSTYFSPSRRTLHISAWDNPTRSFPDTWDRDVIFHEYGHLVEHDLGFFDEGGGPHEWTQLVGREVAASEGFAHFISSLYRDDPKQRNMYNDFTDTSWVDVENGEYGKNEATYGSANHAGIGFEASNAGMLWDIYDDQDFVEDSIEDYSTFGLASMDWDPDTGYGHDGIGDSLALGHDEIFTTLWYRWIDGHHPDNMDEFWEAWWSSPQPGHGQAMEDIWYEHGDSTAHCCAVRGNIDHLIGPAGPIDVSDLTYLVAYLFTGGQYPPCPEEGNVDGLTPGGIPIDVADLNYLVAKLFTGGPNPPPCP